MIKVAKLILYITFFCSIFGRNVTFAESDIPTVRIGIFTRSLSFVPYMVAKSKGWWEEALAPYGATVEYTEFQSLPSINEAFASDRLDVVFEAEAPAIIGRAAGIDIKLKRMASSHIQRMIVQNDPAIKSIKDLRGKKIALLAGSSSHYGVNHLLVQNGLSAKDVEIIDMHPADAKAAFDSKQISAWGIWPPYPEQELLAGNGKTLPKGKYLIQAGVIFRGAFEREHPEVTKDLLKVVRKSQNWIVAHPAEARSLVAKEFNLPLAVIEKAWPTLNFHPKVGRAEIRDLQNKADFLYDSKFVKRRVDVAKELLELQ